MTFNQPSGTWTVLHPLRGILRRLTGKTKETWRTTRKQWPSREQKWLEPGVGVSEFSKPLSLAQQISNALRMPLRQRLATDFLIQYLVRSMFGFHVFKPIYSPHLTTQAFTITSFGLPGFREDLKPEKKIKMNSGFERNPRECPIRSSEGRESA